MPLKFGDLAGKIAAIQGEKDRQKFEERVAHAVAVLRHSDRPLAFLRYDREMLRIWGQDVLAEAVKRLKEEQDGSIRG